ncbi:hypothetical protein NWE55_01745 [Myroides albus]|uniref:hypothetical protein n=1 Tax=Myroides albus TaxID=2562892 RepID=UPI0021599D91|nr:hypothetical protein [Myroides albus]UVD80041.1 hypothetical protein NWE55_01745 [Myroides albus]
MKTYNNKVSSNSIISFESAIFKQSLDISRANFWCKLTFWNSEIENTIPKEIGLYCTDDIEKVSVLEPKKEAYKKIRESYRIIKNEFTKEGNAIDSLDFFNYEMIAYKEEKRRDIEREEKRRDIEKKLSEFFIWLRFTNDRFLIWLNKISNDNGTNWFRGICFTLIITLIFYLIFLLTISGELMFSTSKLALKSTLKHFVEFLNVSKWDIKPFGIDSYDYGYVVLFIGRLFIAYGYYQTIQAFRKYGKK